MVTFSANKYANKPEFIKNSFLWPSGYVMFFTMYVAINEGI